MVPFVMEQSGGEMNSSCVGNVELNSCAFPSNEQSPSEAPRTWKLLFAFIGTMLHSTAIVMHMPV